MTNDVSEGYNNVTGAVSQYVASQGDDILVTGTSGSGHFTLLRYTSNGVLDSTFGTGGEATPDAGILGQSQSVAIDSQGRIIVAGSMQDAAGQGFGLACYTCGAASLTDRNNRLKSRLIRPD